MVRKTLVVVALLALAACKNEPANPGGNNPPPGGGPTGPGPVATTGTISGDVTSAGAGVSGAFVVLGTASSATTSPVGQYTFADIAPGTHTLSLAVPRAFRLGAGETSAKSTTVTAGQTSTVNWTLVPAPVEPPGPVTVTWVVSLLASSFSPSAVTIRRGDTVLWTNMQPLPHTITPDDRQQPGGWPSENMTRGGSTFSHAFNTEGTFNYSCLIHAGMTGVVTVR